MEKQTAYILQQDPKTDIQYYYKNHEALYKSTVYKIYIQSNK